MLKSRRDYWRNSKRHNMSLGKLMQWGRHRRQHVMQDKLGNDITCQIIYCWLGAPCRDNANFKSCWHRTGLALNLSRAGGGLTTSTARLSKAASWDTSRRRMQNVRPA